MKLKEIKVMNNNDLELKLVELKGELMKANTESAVSTPKNPGRIGQIRKNIARILTLKREKSKKEGGHKKE